MYKYATMNFYSGSTMDSYRILLYKCWNVLGAKYKQVVPTDFWWPSLVLGGEVVWV